jgi:hypothetical protein
MADQSLTDLIATLDGLLRRRTGSAEERRILDLLRPLQGPDFAGLVQALDLRRLLSVLDRRAWGKDSRAEFLLMLEKFVGLLSLDTKVVLANLLAEGRTTFREEKALRAIFLSERGPGLTDLKLRIDTSAIGHDLLGLLTGDIDAPELRFDILKHFKEAAAVPADPRQRPLRVVSDIDDTLYSSLNDSRYPRGTLYKGVLELFSALSEQPPVFLTARPELVAALLERLTHRQLRRYGLTHPTVLSGSLPGLMGHRRMAEQKARTLISYTEMYPEFRFVFFGDSGQGDMALSESLLKMENSVIERALIHKLSDRHAGARTNNPRIHLFCDYAEAAEHLHDLGYLDLESRDKVTGLVRAAAVEAAVSPAGPSPRDAVPAPPTLPTA